MPGTFQVNPTFWGVGLRIKQNILKKGQVRHQMVIGFVQFIHMLIGRIRILTLEE